MAIDRILPTASGVTAGLVSQADKRLFRTYTVAFRTIKQAAHPQMDSRKSRAGRNGFELQ